MAIHGDWSDSIRINKSNNYHCCVPNCYSNGRYDFQLSFHKFPKDDEMRKKWIVKIRRDIGPEFQVWHWFNNNAVEIN